MSKGLGVAQRLVLIALASLEAENGDTGPFDGYAIVERVYAMSQPMQDREHGLTVARAGMAANIRERAEQGGDRAAPYLTLTRGLQRSTPSPHQRRTTPFWLTETGVNPSRVLASLARRGLVSRKAIRGGGSVGLTDEGRSVARLLSVGTSWRFGREAVDA